MGKAIKERRDKLTAELAKQVDSKEKEESKLTTKTKKTKSTQVQTKENHPSPQTEGEFLSSKDLAGMAGVEPRLLRRCLRKDFAGRISTVKGDNGLKTYHIKADDPIVKEIVAKLSGNGGKSTTPVKGKEVK